MDKKILAIVGALAVTAAAGSASAGGGNLVVNGDFSAGNTGFSTGYALTTMTPQLFQNGVHGIYAVIPVGDVNGQASYGDWHNVTTDPSGHNGNVYVADGATDPNVTVWSQTVAVKQNTNYTFSFDAVEISNSCCSNAVFAPTIGGTAETAVGLTGGWQNYSYVWNSGSNTSALLSLTDTNTSGGFNDFLLTDISLTGPGVPEPGTWGLMILGAGLSGAALRRRRAALAA